LTVGLRPFDHLVAVLTISLSPPADCFVPRPFFSCSDFFERPNIAQPLRSVWNCVLDPTADSMNLKRTVNSHLKCNVRFVEGFSLECSQLVEMLRKAQVIIRKVYKKRPAPSFEKTPHIAQSAETQQPEKGPPIDYSQGLAERRFSLCAHRVEYGILVFTIPEAENYVHSCRLFFGREERRCTWNRFSAIAFRRSDAL